MVDLDSNKNVAQPAGAGDADVGVDLVAELMTVDLASSSVRELNGMLHRGAFTHFGHVTVTNPNGAHNLAVGLNAPISVDIRGHVGYFVAGMNKQATIRVHGHAGKSAAENIMSGRVEIMGNASDSVAASGHGGLVVVRGNASSRVGISLKGADIVIGGNAGHAAAFMAQAGRIVICGDAGANLGDSLYEAVIYVAGSIHSLGADANEEPMTDADRAAVADLLLRAHIQADIRKFKRVASMRALYHWNGAHRSEY